ncbi:MAG: dihydropteroate synthase [Clostridia bacterium]|nr:dihydropteroate synthase [Clostridia bacterium]
MIIGELLNSSRKSIRSLIEGQNEAALLEIAQSQVAAGADYLDLNCGAFVKDEVERLAWLVDTVAAAVDKPLCLDSPNARALAAALPLARGPVMINSISAETARYREILPLALEYKTKLVALCMDDEAIPTSAEARYAIGARLTEDLLAAGISPDDIYLDPMVQPIAVSARGALVIFDTVRLLRNNYPGVHCVCGLSNISFGLPNRRLINRYFLAQAIACGIDSFILDPTDRQLMGCYVASRALIGEDKFCAKYLKAHRGGLFAE